MKNNASETPLDISFTSRVISALFGPICHSKLLPFLCHFSRYEKSSQTKRFIAALEMTDRNKNRINFGIPKNLIFITPAHPPPTIHLFHVSIVLNKWWASWLSVGELYFFELPAYPPDEFKKLPKQLNTRPLMSAASCRAIKSLTH